MLIAAASPAAVRHDEAVAGVSKIVQQFARIVVVDDGSDRNRHFDRRSFAPGAIAAFPVTPALGRMLGIETEMQQGVVVLAGDQNYVAAAPAVATARPSARNVFFAPERQASVAAVARLHTNSYFIDEHGEVAAGKTRAPRRRP